MDFRQIIYFLGVHDAGSFTKASRNESVAQPALSVQIRRLEEELGVALFERHANGVVPTVAGSHFYQLCQSIVERISEAKAAMAAFRSQVSGHIAVGLPPSVNRSVLGAFLPGFMETYPNVEVTLREASSHALAAMTLDGTVDFAVANRPESEAGLTLRPFHAEPFVLASNNPAFGPMLQPVDLSRAGPLKLVASPHYSGGKAIAEHIRRSGVSVARTMAVDGFIGTIEMIRRSSDWCTIVSLGLVFPEAEEGSINLHPLLGLAVPYELYMMHLPHKPLSPAASAFLAMLESAFADYRARWTEVFGDRLMPPRA